MGTLAEVLVSQQSTSGPFTTYTTAKTVIAPTSLAKLPTNYLCRIGQRLRFKIRGAISNIVTTPGTITFQIMIGSIVVWTSGAIQLNATAHTTLPFTLEVDLRVASIGSGTAAAFRGMGTLSGVMFTRTAAQVDDVNTPGSFEVPATAPANGTGFDSTIDNVLDFWTGFSISNAGNGIQIEIYDVENLN